MELSYYKYNYLFKPLIGIYLRFTTRTSHDGFKLRISPGVFHPGFFFSTNFFYTFISDLQLNNKNFLELGCGSGLLSLLAFRMGAKVTSVDINPTAVKDTVYNFETNFKEKPSVSVIESDLFNNLTTQTFDIIIINPPYFFKKATQAHEMAWYCGENGEYFEKLFRTLNDHIHKDSEVYLSLADNCDIAKIKEIAVKHGFAFRLAAQKKVKWEMNYIYNIIRTGT
jgi:release factor glutamine methyltransferase